MTAGVDESALQAAAVHGANAGQLAQPVLRERDAPRAKASGPLGAIVGPSKADVWRQVASDIGAEYQERGLLAGDVVRYRSGDWEITLDTWIEVGGDDSTTYTRMRAPFVNRDVLCLKICRRGLFTSVGTFFGTQDIQIGDPSFDEDFVIQGNNHTRIRSLLGDVTLKELIQAQPDLRLEIRPDPGTWDDKDLLVFKCRGVLKDEILLKGLFELFGTALARLAELDSSSRQTISPRITPVYEKPDGWSKVLCQLPEHAPVEVCGTEGNFLKIITDNHVVGYISHSARDRVVATGNAS